MSELRRAIERSHRRTSGSTHNVMCQFEGCDEYQDVKKAVYKAGKVFCTEAHWVLWECGMQKRLRDAL